MEAAEAPTERAVERQALLWGVANTAQPPEEGDPASDVPGKTEHLAPETVGDDSERWVTSIT